MRSYLLRNTDRFVAFVDRWSRRLAYVAIILAFIVIIFPALFTMCSKAGPATIRPMTEAERKEAKRLHRKHGVPASICDHNGKNCYFYRDGKRCRLI